MSSQRSNKKPKSYYVDYARRNTRFGQRGGGGNLNNLRYKDTPDISFGNKGFLITSLDEVKSYLEMRNILEEYFEILHKNNVDIKDSAKDEEKNLTVEDEIEAELKQLRVTKPFKQVKTHCRNTIFINISRNHSYLEPIPIVDQFFNDLAEKRAIKSKNTFKVLPILDTFRNNVSSAKESISHIFKDSFKEGETKRYFVELQARGNYKLDSEEKQKLIEGVAEIVSELRPSWTVSRENVDYMIVLVCLKDVCCISILKDYFQRARYNVIEFCKEFSPTEDDKEEPTKTEVEPAPETGEQEEHSVEC